MKPKKYFKIEFFSLEQCAFIQVYLDCLCLTIIELGRIDALSPKMSTEGTKKRENPSEHNSLIFQWRKL